MLDLRKTAACMLTLLSIAVSVSAAEVPEPAEVIQGQSEELKTIQKVYVLPKTESSDIIPVEEFTEDETKYAFTELLTQDNSQEDIREHTETISIHTSSANTQTVISHMVKRVIRLQKTEVIRILWMQTHRLYHTEFNKYQLEVCGK